MAPRPARRRRGDRKHRPKRVRRVPEPVTAFDADQDRADEEYELREHFLRGLLPDD